MVSTPHCGCGNRSSILRLDTFFSFCCCSVGVHLTSDRERQNPLCLRKPDSNPLAEKDSSHFYIVLVYLGVDTVFFGRDMHFLHKRFLMIDEYLCISPWLAVSAHSLQCQIQDYHNSHHITVPLTRILGSVLTHVCISVYFVSFNNLSTLLPVSSIFIDCLLF